MNKGKIYEILIENFNLFEHVSDDSGLDVVSFDRKIIIELKSRTNTDNASSKKTNFHKLATYKLNNPDFRCIYGCINENTQEKTGKDIIGYYIDMKNVEIEIYTGYELLNLIFGDLSTTIIEFARNCINKYYN